MTIVSYATSNHNSTYIRMPPMFHSTNRWYNSSGKWYEEEQLYPPLYSIGVLIKQVIFRMIRISVDYQGELVLNNDLCIIAVLY